jgi:hypothetical protein
MIYNIQLIDFNDFFVKNIQKEILDNILSLQPDQQKIQLSKPEIKQIITNLINFHIDKLFSKISLNKTIIIVQPYIIQNTEIENYAKESSLKNLLNKILKNIHIKWPNRIFLFKEKVNINSIDLQFLIFHKSNQY